MNLSISLNPKMYVYGFLGMVSYLLNRCFTSFYSSNRKLAQPIFLKKKKLKIIHEVTLNDDFYVNSSIQII